MRQWLCGVFTNHHPVNSATREIASVRCLRCGRVFGSWSNDVRRKFEEGYRAGRTCSYPVPMDDELKIPRWQVEEVARTVLGEKAD